MINCGHQQSLLIAHLLLKAPSLSVSSTGLSGGPEGALAGEPGAQQHHKSLQDCRWFTAGEQQIEHQVAFAKKSRGDKSESAEKKAKLFCASSWHDQGAAGKLFAAATNSTSFVDKLLAHVIKRGSGSGNSEKCKLANGKNQKVHRGEQAKTTTTTMSEKEKEKEKVGSQIDSGKPMQPAGGAGEQKKKKNVIAQSGAGGGGACAKGGVGGSIGSGLNLLTDLSRRLARRCGVKTKAAPVQPAASESAHTETSSESGLGVVSTLSLTERSGDSSERNFSQMTPTTTTTTTNTATTTTATTQPYSTGEAAAATTTCCGPNKGLAEQAKVFLASPATTGGPGDKVNCFIADAGGRGDQWAQHQQQQQRQGEHEQHRSGLHSTDQAHQMKVNSNDKSTQEAQQQQQQREQRNESKQTPAPQSIQVQPQNIQQEHEQNQQRAKNNKDGNQSDLIRNSIDSNGDGGVGGLGGGCGGKSSTSENDNHLISSKYLDASISTLSTSNCCYCDNGNGATTKTTTMARNNNSSSINLASLATVANRFSSASVGNLWHGAHQGSGHHHHHHNDITAGELADDSAEGIRPLDYTKHGAFDSYHPEDLDQTNNNNSSGANPNKLSPKMEPRSVKSASSNKLLSVASCGSTRKLSTKEKCKRQKDAERVEKLRLLVSYLKSGSSQPIVSPVALEADEIELAERYKLHVVLRDLQASEQEQQQQQNTQPGGNQSLSPPRSVTSASASDVVSAAAASSASKQAHGETSSVDALKKNSSLINHSIGGTTTSSPATSSSSSSMNQSAHHHNSHHHNHRHHHHHHHLHHHNPTATNEGRSIPHIGNVSWVLRHSISDPGNNNFEHSTGFSAAAATSSSPSTRDHHNHHHHHHNNNNSSLHHHNPHHHDHLQCDQHEDSSHQGDPTTSSISSQAGQNSESCDQCRSCAPSSSHSDSSLSTRCLSSNSNSKNAGPAAQLHDPLGPANQQGQQELPKLFYIDDTDPIPANFSSSSPIAAMTSPTSATGGPQPPLPTRPPNSPSASVSTINYMSQPSTPAVSDASVGGLSANDRNSSCASTSAWTNPQNLATWIDNEVNSLVHDLEAKSQQLKIKNESKHNKSGKKKWLSVTGSYSSRRSSSGASST